MVSVAHVSRDRKTVGEILKQKSITHTEKGGGEEGEDTFGTNCFSPVNRLKFIFF